MTETKNNLTLNRESTMKRFNIPRVAHCSDGCLIGSRVWHKTARKQISIR